MRVSLVLRSLTVSLGAVIVAPPGCDDASIDTVLWACESDDDCGEGAHCDAGVCALTGSTIGGALTCQVSSSPSAEFSVAVFEGQRVLVFEQGTHLRRFPLPAEVIGLARGPIAGCCTATCCSD